MKKTIYSTIIIAVFYLNASAQWVSLNSTITKNFTSIYFPSQDSGFAVNATFGSTGTIMATTDGVTWQQQYADSNYLESVYFLTTRVGWVGGGGFINGSPNGIVLKTTDGGATWNPQITAIMPVISVFFINDSTGWAAANDATQGNYFIYKSTNGGRNWALQKSGFDYIRSVFFINPSIGWIAADNGRIFKTTDGGSNWNLLNTGVVFHFNSIFFISPLIGWSVGQYGNGGCYKTTDGGTTWQPQSIPTIHALSSVHFTSATNGWAVGENGVILRTIDGGSNWVLQTPVNSNFLSAVHFPTSSIGYAAGVSGTIIKYGSVNGLSEIGSDRTFEIYPNPATNAITIHTSQSVDATYSILDASGRKIKSGTILYGSSSIDVSELANGFYVVETGDKGNTKIKLIKQ